MKLQFLKNLIKKYKTWLTIIIIIFVFAVIFVFYCSFTIKNCSKFCYGNIEEIPQRRTALLLGTAQINSQGNPNLYFLGRIEATAKLYHAGKIEHILISGDNSRIDYNEPQAMKNELIKRNIPASAMTLDYAGFRTLDSVVRAKTVFGYNSFTVITQQGHAERSVYIAKKHGIDAIAFYADEPIFYRWLLYRNRTREFGARVLAWLDVNILKRKPKFEK